MVVPRQDRPKQLPLAERKLRYSFEARLAALALLGGAPGALLSLYTMRSAGFSEPMYWTLATAVLLCWLGAALLLRERLTLSLRTISNILMAFREGDYSLRAAKASRDDPLGEILVELNLFADVLRSGRLKAVESTLLLEQVMAAVDVAIFAFNAEARLRLCNPAGAALLRRGQAAALGTAADELGLAAALAAENGATVELALGGGVSRYFVRKGQFRAEGEPHTFLALGEAGPALRREEREAWRRLVRVLGHEINNSLSPIKSIASTLRGTVQRDPLPGDWREDLHEGLEIIESRAEALRRFTTGYAALARVPEPRRARIEFGALARRAAELETRVHVQVADGPVVELDADAGQIEQVLINLLRNAADATLEHGGGVQLRWRAEGAWLAVEVLDGGPGILNPANLFVPFFTTKPGGSGIGLALSRQIAEAHGGALTLENRTEARGCRAVLRLPL